MGRAASRREQEEPTGTSTGTWAYDVRGDEVWCSDETSRLHGYTLDREPTLDDLLDRYTPEERRTVRDHLERAVEDGEAFELDVTVETADGDQFLTVGGHPEHRDGEVVRVAGFVERREELEKLERQVQVLREASQDLMAAETEQEVAELLADASKGILGYVNTTIRLVDDEERTLRTMVSTEEVISKAGERPDYAVDEDNTAARTYRTGEPALIESNVEQLDDDRDRGELLSGLYAPIGEHGVMSVGDTELNAFDENDLETASLLGQLGSEALLRIESERRLQRQNERLEEFIRDMSASIEEVTATTEQVDAVVEETVEAAHEGDDALDTVAEQMDEIENRVDRAVEEVEQLNEAVGEIDEVIDLIDDVAERTNILALNASIEAARAGEAGQGFAVVAREVKELAEETQNATDEVESLIRRTEGHTERTTDRIQQTTGIVSEARTSTDRTSDLFDEIVERITESSEGVTEIAETMNQQASSIEAMATSLEE